MLRFLESRDFLSVTQLSKDFGVSEVTSGTTSPSSPAWGSSRASAAECVHSSAGSPRSRSTCGCGSRPAEDRRSPRAAAALIEEGEAVALDSSTTAYYLALELRAKHDLVVVTNGLLIAAALADAPGHLGARHRRDAAAVRDVARRRPRRRRPARRRGSTRASSARAGSASSAGLMDLNPDEVRTEAGDGRRRASRCSGSSTGRSGIAARCSRSPRPTRVHGIVTDASAPAPRSRPGAPRGVEVIVAEPTGPPESHRDRPRELRRRVRDAGGREPDGDDGRRRPRRAERPRRRRQLRRRAAGGDRGAPVPRTSRSGSRTGSTGTCSPSTGRCSPASRAGAAAEPIDSIGVDSWGGRLRARRRAAQADRQPRPLPRQRGARPRSSRRSSASRRASCTSAPASRSCRSTRSTSSPAMAAEDDPALAGAETAAHDPRPRSISGSAGTCVGEWTNATTTQCLDARTGGWADDLLERLDDPDAAAARSSSSRARSLGPLDGERRRRDRPRHADCRRGRDPRHRLGGRGGPVPARPARPTSAPARGRSSAWSCGSR